MQVVGYDTGTPALFVSTSDGLDSVDLEPGTELDYRLENRHCAGTIHDDTHLSCLNERAPYCDDHRSTWVCAKCTGTCLKDEMDCYEDHAVYLAAFAPNTFKVGVTRLWRLETRLREQGADRAAHVRTFSDGRVAREYEAELAQTLVDRVRVPTKISGFGRDVDETAWNELLADFDPIDTFEFDYGFDLTDAPLAETIATGTVRGSKGRVLVIDNGGTTYAVDMRNLVGYELERGGTDRNLQSSLGAFG
ncbi:MULTISPECIES: DUF2797 domain-containing protein [Haloferax]|uniref:DUF2797 domain-containing protein n=2 Tax=Haloferax TaxID=2251 RepID=A0A6G1Z4W5_9EURY|nr:MULTISPECIES: DUF2797 domain-containing protein [Haloferax]KAB1188755.1 DUF2797 domain-containing protein [Haloferax sp. CBA1149]MRW81468.1 DUF2797 domain-containing protein [Haloferax marinisediminis]